MKDTGGPAFPIPKVDGFRPHPGMTLRDYFAGQALVRCQPDDEENTTMAQRKLARWAYAVADAMLKERQA